MLIREKFFSNKKIAIHNLAVFFRTTPFLIILATVFIIDNNLANSNVSGKYFWFYGSMGLTCVAALIYSILKYRVSGFGFRVSLTDCFVSFFVGGIFLSALLFGEVSTNTTKLTLLALLLVLFFCLRLMLADNNDFQGIAGFRFATSAMTLLSFS